MSPLPFYHTDCREFSGYRPCRFKRPCEGCLHYRARSAEILIINLDGLGDVLRTTAMLPAIKREHPEAHVTWLTRPEAVALLDHIPHVDEVVGLSFETLEPLHARSFDLLLNADKSALAASVAMRLDARHRRGFGLNSRGVIFPLNAGAERLYALGLDDEYKFLKNRESMETLLADAWELPYQDDPYQFRLSEDERIEADSIRLQLLETTDQWHGGSSQERANGGVNGDEQETEETPIPNNLGVLVGINTGCNPAYPYKRLPATQQVALIKALLEQNHKDGLRVLLLGGPSETTLNEEIAQAVGSARLYKSPTRNGIREGAVWLAACDIILTGDTLALHMAIALERLVVSWFGLTCHQEINPRGLGCQILSSAECRPCWQQQCEKEPKCNTRVSNRLLLGALGEMIEATRAGQHWRGESLRWKGRIGGFWEPPRSKRPGATSASLLEQYC